MTLTSPQRPSARPRQFADVAGRIRATFDSSRTRGYEWRAEQLAGLERMLAECDGQFAAALEADLQRTPFEARLFDVAPTRGEVKHARKHLRSWMRPRRVHAPLSVRPGRAWYQHEPLGVVLIIAPWNYPIHLAIAPLVGALAAGNCAVIKPSEVTPACSAVLGETLPRYVDPDAVAVVEGGAEASLGLLEQGLDHCFFTGSPTVGRAIMTAAAQHLTPVTLELGGKCPAVVTASAHLEIAARRIAFGKLVNSGQTCVAPDYVLVERPVRDQFVDRITATVRQFSEGRRVPIVNEHHAARLADLVHGAGGHTTLGGTIDVADAWAEPTVMVDPRPDAAILREEIFGPVLPVVTVDSLDDAIAYIGRGSRPLASYLFTEDPGDERQFLAEITTGATVINHVMMHLAVSDLPFGGVGVSGTGRYHGHWGFETFSNTKAVLAKPSRPDVAMFYPPYGKLAKRIMDAML